MDRISTKYCFIALLGVSLLCGGCRGRREDRAFNPVLQKELAAIKDTPASFSYKVKRGDTMWRISRHFGVGLSKLAEANRMEVTTSLKIGQSLRIPTGDSIGSAPPAADAVPRGSEASGYTWPVKGRIVTAFGALKGGLKSQGVDILTEPGTSVVASGKGTVCKAGPFVGLGNTVIIQHDGKGEMISLYGNLGDLNVSKGDSVSKRQMIASVPYTSGGKPEIHLRMFRKGVPVDPRRYVK